MCRCVFTSSNSGFDDFDVNSELERIEKARREKRERESREAQRRLEEERREKKLYERNERIRRKEEGRRERERRERERKERNEKIRIERERREREERLKRERNEKKKREREERRKREEQFQARILLLEECEDEVFDALALKYVPTRIKEKDEIINNLAGQFTTPELKSKIDSVKEEHRKIKKAKIDARTDKWAAVILLIFVIIFIIGLMMSN